MPQYFSINKKNKTLNTKYPINKITKKKKKTHNIIMNNTLVLVKGYIKGNCPFELPE